MKRSLFSLVAGCLAALVVNSFTARPLWGAIFHPQMSAIANLPNGIRLAYESFGAEDAPAILLIMGLGVQLVRWNIELWPCRPSFSTAVMICSFA